MAADAKAKRIALLMLGKPTGAPGGGGRPGAGGPMGTAGEEDAPPDDEEDGETDELVGAMSDLRSAMRDGDDEGAAAAFRAAVRSVEG